MADNAILDLARLQEAFEDDVEGIAELLEMALETGAKHLAALREGIARHDIVAVGRAAHSIKGSASNIGAGNVTGFAATLESDARDGRWERLTPLAGEIERAYAQLRSAVAAYRAALG